MMAALTRRGEALAAAAQRTKIEALAQRLKSLLGDAAVEVEGSRVMVRGRGIMKRWLTDPALRFLK